MTTRGQQFKEAFELAMEATSQLLYMVEPTHEKAREPGSYMQALLGAAFKADGSNLAILARAYPLEMTLIRLYQLEGVEGLTKILTNGVFLLEMAEKMGLVDPT